MKGEGTLAFLFSGALPCTTAILGTIFSTALRRRLRHKKLPVLVELPVKQYYGELLKFEVLFEMRSKSNWTDEENRRQAICAGEKAL